MQAPFQLVVVKLSSRPLKRAALALIIQSFSFCFPAWPCRDAAPRLAQRSANYFGQPSQRRLPVSILALVSLGLDNDNAIVGNSVIR